MVTDVAATASANNVLASDRRALFGQALTRRGMQHLCDSTVAGPGVRRDNVLASKYEEPPFRNPPFKRARCWSVKMSSHTVILLQFG